MQKLKRVLFIDYTEETEELVSNIRKHLDLFIENNMDIYPPFCDFCFDYNDEAVKLMDVYDSLRNHTMNLWINEGKVDRDGDKLVAFIMGPNSPNIQNACIKIAQYIAFIPDMKRQTKILNDGTILMIATTSDLFLQFPEDLGNIESDVGIERKVDYVNLIDDYIKHLIGHNEMDLETMDGKRQAKMFLVSPLQLDPDDLNYHQKNITRLLDMKLYDIGVPYPRAKAEIVYIDGLIDRINGLTPSEIMNVMVAIPFGHNDDWQFNIEEEANVTSELFGLLIKNVHVPLTSLSFSNCREEFQGIKFYIYGNNMMTKRLQGESFAGLILDELREYHGE